MQIALWLHLLGVLVWVGGMFFAHMVLRPAVQALDPPVRLALLAAVLGGFLRWVAFAIVLILASGAFLTVALAGSGPVATYVKVMTVLGVMMIAIYGYLVVGPYRRLTAAVSLSAWPQAGTAAVMIRRLIGLNLILGLVTTTVALLGHAVAP